MMNPKTLSPQFQAERVPVTVSKRLLVLSGPSGVGKGTVCEKLRQKLPHLIQPVSLTTRAQRPGEIHGEHYWFVSRTTFEAKRHAGELLEWVEYNGCYYGTETLQVRDALDTGNILLLEIDTHGALTLKDQFSEEAYLIFLLPPSHEELRQRLEKRGTNTPDDIARRLMRAEWELSQRERFDLQVENHRIDATVDALHDHLKGLLSETKM